MNERSHSLLLVLWWLPHHIQDKILTSYVTNTDFSDLSCWLSSWPSILGVLCSCRGELTDSPRARSARPSLWLCTSSSGLSGGSLPPHAGLLESSALGNVPRWRAPSFLGASVVSFTTSVLVFPQCSASQIIRQKACGGQGPGLSHKHDKYKPYLPECLLSAKPST